MGMAYLASMARMMATSSAFSSCPPCEKLSRNTSAPARKRSSITSRVHDDGPKVAICLTRLAKRGFVCGVARIPVASSSESVVTGRRVWGAVRDRRATRGLVWTSGAKAWQTAT